MNVDIISKTKKKVSEGLASRINAYKVVANATVKRLPLGAPTYLYVGRTRALQTHQAWDRAFATVHWAKAAASPVMNTQRSIQASVFSLSSP